MPIPITITTPQSRMHVGSETNASVTAFALPLPTVTEPTSVEASGVIVVDAPRKRNLTSLIFFGAGADNTQLDLLVWRWYRKFQADEESDLWIPQIVASLVDLQLGTLVGIAGQIPSATDRFADGVGSVEADTANRQTVITDPTDTQYGLVIDTFGCQKLQVNFQGGTTPATNGNFLYQGD